MRTPKSKNLRHLLQNYYIAAFSNQHPDIPLKEVIVAGNSDLLTRRKFVEKVSQSAVLLGVTSTFPILGSCSESVKKSNLPANLPKIVIVGAGMAGLNCAYQLTKQGVYPDIYEGSFRVGGRILTHYGDALQMGIHPEFGGDFIDSDHQDMLDLAKEFKLELTDLVKEQEEAHLIKDAYFFNNKNYTEEEVIEEFKKCSPIIAADAESLGEDYDTESATRFDNMPLSQYINALPVASWLKELLEAAYIAEFGLECSEQSSLNMLDMINPDTSEGFQVFGSSDERYRIKAGNSKLIESIKNQLLAGTINLNAKLTAIKNAKKGYLLSFEGMENVYADIVVMTIPFTTLRDVKINLKEMTPEKKQCIEELGYGNNTKVVLGYENRPWREGENHFMGYLFNSLMSNGWDSSDIKSVPSNKGAYVAFLGGKISAAMDEKGFKDPKAPSHHVWKTQLPDEDINKFVDELNKVFINSKNTYANKHVFADWVSYPWVKASYSAYKVGQWSTISGQEQTNVGNIFFAGEHCSSDFQGFMNGAAETGRVAAENIMKQILKKK